MCCLAFADMHITSPVTGLLLWNERGRLHAKRRFLVIAPLNYARGHAYASAFNRHARFMRPARSTRTADSLNNDGIQVPAVIINVSGLYVIVGFEIRNRQSEMRFIDVFEPTKRTSLLHCRVAAIGDWTAHSLSYELVFELCSRCLNTYMNKCFYVTIHHTITVITYVINKMCLHTLSIKKLKKNYTLFKAH